MGLMDKLSRVIKDADKVKDALESAGLVGSDAGTTATATPGDPGPAPTPARSGAYRAIAARCVTDPFDLLTRQEVEELTGLDVGAPDEWHSDDCIGVEFRSAANGGHWVRVDAFPTRPDPASAPDATTTWQFVSTETATPRVPVDGLGDEASVAAGALVCVRVREQVLVVSGSLPPGADAALTLTSVARTGAAPA